MSYSGPERRRHPRVTGRFIVSYRIMNESDNIDISQTKNIGMGGMLLTTNKRFDNGVNLALEIRLPFDPHPIMIIGRVLESKEIIEDMIYDTRIEFLAVDERHKKVINETVGYYIKKEKEG
ncbi:MAG: PilZ domain-containing protein [Candidatus Omnitrophica bacterium]|nr:PilZ domain-containing protein [Candidatus Omnitrophota bacterium]